MARKKEGPRARKIRRGVLKKFAPKTATDRNNQSNKKLCTSKVKAVVVLKKVPDEQAVLQVRLLLRSELLKRKDKLSVTQVQILILTM